MTEHWTLRDATSSLLTLKTAANVLTVDLEQATLKDGEERLLAYGRVTAHEEWPDEDRLGRVRYH